MATNSAQNDSAMVCQFRNSTSENAINTRTSANSRASLRETVPAGSGRARVRRTWRSNSTSTVSFQTHPAERISRVPTQKITTTDQSGQPLELIHTAHKVGHSSNKVPMGLSSRIRRSYSVRRCAMFI